MKLYTNSKLLGWLFFISFSLFLLYRILIIWSIQPDLGGVENTIVYFIQKDLSGISIYTNPELPPYSINQYGPLYYSLAVFIGKLLKINPDDVLIVFILNRSLSLFLNLLYAVIVFLIGRNVLLLTKSRSIAVAIFTFIFIEITSFARADSLNHVFFFLALYFFLLGSKIKFQNKTYLILAALISVLAFFTKQSSFALAAIIFFWLFFSKQYKALPIYLTTYLFTFLACLLIIANIYGLDAFYMNAVLGVNNGINLGLFWGNIIKPFFASFGLLFLPAAIFLFYFLRKQKEDYLRFLAYAMILQLIISTLFSLKFGSHINYFTEFWTLLFLCAAFSWDAFVKAMKETVFPIFPNFSIALLLCLKIALVSFPLFKELTEGNKNRKPFFEKEKKVADDIEKDIGDSSGLYVFNDLFSPQSFMNNLLYKKAILPQEEIVFFTTYQRKVFDYSNFKNLFSTGKVKYIISNSSDNIPHFLDFTINGYSLKKEIEGYKIFVYNDSIPRK